MKIRSLSDPTYIFYGFYFADDKGKQELLNDYNFLVKNLGCEELNLQKLEEYIKEIKIKNLPYEIICKVQHEISSVICMLHPVQDTLILQVSYNGGTNASDPEKIWKEALNLLSNLTCNGYGMSKLFVVNFKIPKLFPKISKIPWEILQDEDSKVIKPLRLLAFSYKWFISRKISNVVDSCISTISNFLNIDAHRNYFAEGPNGYLRQLAEHVFFLLVYEGSREHHSASFQCGTFPRLEMQIHKVKYYEKLSQEAKEIPDTIVNLINTTQKVSSKEQLEKLISLSILEFETVKENVESAIKNFQSLLGTCSCELNGNLWKYQTHRLETLRDNINHELNEIKRAKEFLNTLPAWEIPSLNLDSLNLENIDSSIKDELVKVHQTLFSANNPVAAILHLSVLCLKFIDILFSTIGKKRPSDNLNECIKEAEKLNLLPNEMSLYLHVIRVLSNKIRPDALKINITREDAELALGAFIRVIKWYYNSP